MADLNIGGGRVDGTIGPRLVNTRGAGDAAPSRPAGGPQTGPDAFVHPMNSTYPYRPLTGDDVDVLPTPGTLAGAFENVYIQLERYTVELYNAERKAAADAEELKKQRSLLISNASDDPKALGANEAAREANMNMILAAFVTRAKDSERAALHIRQNCEMLRLRIQRLNTLLNLAKLETEQGNDYNHRKADPADGL